MNSLKNLVDKFKLSNYNEFKLNSNVRLYTKKKMHMNKYKTFQLIAEIILVACMIFSFGYAAQHTDVKSSDKLGVSFNSDFEIYVTFTATLSGEEFYCRMFCGFDDGLLKDYDYVRLYNPDCALGVYVKGWCVSSAPAASPDTGWHTCGQVINIKRKVKHTGKPVAYEMTIKVN